MRDMGDIFRVVLTGGPCAGKSTIISTLTSYLNSKGFNVLHVQESATILKNSGITWSPELSHQFQVNCISLQQVREKIACRWGRKIAKNCAKKKTIILFDRAMCDGLAFVSEECFKACINEVGIQGDLLDRYDAIFHLVTAADGAVKFYKNTSYRHEEPKEAVRQDKVLRTAWGGHRNHFMFTNEASFETKIENVISRLCKLLGLNVLRRTCIRYLLESKPVIPEDQEIVQEVYYKTYINYQSNEEGFQFAFLRYSERKNGGCAQYVLKQVFQQHGQQITKKRRLTRVEYFELLRRKDSRRMIVKQNRSFIMLPDRALLEIVEYVQPTNNLHLLNIYKVKNTEFDDR
eukprot:UN02035